MPATWQGCFGKGIVTGINGNIVEAIITSPTKINTQSSKIPSEYISTGKHLLAPYGWRYYLSCRKNNSQKNNS